MKLHQLRALVACADHRSLRAAADALALSHPAVTKTVRELEVSLGVPLVVRSAQGVTLTAHGETLCVRARQVLADLRRAEEEIHQLKGGQGGRVAIGLTSALALFAMPAVLERMRQSLPYASIEVSEWTLGTYLDRLRDGTLDFFVSPFPAVIPPDCDATELARGRLVAAARSGHPAVQATSLQALTAYEWLYPAPVVDRAQFDDVFLALGHRAPERVTACDSALLALGLMLQGDTLGLFSRPYAEHPLVRHGIRIVPVADNLPEIRLGIIHRKDIRLTSTARQCLNHIRQVMALLPW